MFPIRALISFSLLVTIHGFGGARSPLWRASISKKNALRMLTVEQEVITINTPTGPMKTLIMRPNAPGVYPGVIFYSEIFQLTGPIMRTAQVIAGRHFKSILTIFLK